MKKGRLILAILAFVALSCSNEAGTSYYFDAENGSDANSGLSPKAPFRSFAALDSLRLGPGDKVLLKSGSVFTEKMTVTAKGSEEAPIVITKYGGDALPHIKGDASELEMLYIYNSEHIVVRDIEISNRGSRIRPHLSGVKVELYNYGEGRDITLDRLYVHDVYGSLIKGEGMEHPDAGGGQAMMITCYRDDNTVTVPSYFNGLLVENCVIRDCQRNGIIMWGNWARKFWLPSLNVVFRGNLLEGVPGDGIVPTACDGALVEYNIMRDCPGTLPSSEACDGIWPFSSDNTLVQYNIVSGHKSKTDGYAYDSDYNSRNSTFRYNLSYNNEGGFLLLCNSGGWPEDWSAGNTGTKVMYNVSINDGIRDFIVSDKKDDYFSPIIHITGPTENSTISDNIFVVPAKSKPEMDRRIVCADDWRGYADSTFFVNNSIFVAEPTLAYDPTESTNNFFSGNVYVGPLQYTQEGGFIRHFSDFDQSVWYRGDKAEWDKLIEFLRDKTVPYEGRECPVLDIIGYHEPDTRNATVRVYADSTLASLKDRPIGINVNYLMDGGRFPNAGKPLAESLRELGVRYLRFPGGEKSDFHMFSAPPFDIPQTSVSRTVCLQHDYPGMFTQRGEYVYDPLSFDAFMSVCREIGAEPVVVVPADRYQLKPGKGEWNLSRRQLIDHAAAWVRYANVTKGYGVRYWMIGNESWNSNNPGATAESYARDVIDFSKAMKAVDPGICIVPNGDSEEFFGTLIRTAGDHIDRLCVSNYGVMDFYDGYDTYRYNDKNLVYPAETALKAIERYATPEQKERLGLIVSEYGTIDWFGYWKGTNDIGHTLVNFDMSGQLLTHRGIEFSCFWNTRWLSCGRERNDHDALDENGSLTPVGMSVKLWNDHIGDRMIATSHPDGIVSYASAGSGEGKTYVYLINKTESAREVRVEMAGAAKARLRAQREYYGTSPEDTHPVYADARPARGGAVTLKPYSINVLEYESR